MIFGQRNRSEDCRHDGPVHAGIRQSVPRANASRPLKRSGRQRMSRSSRRPDPPGSRPGLLCSGEPTQPERHSLVARTTASMSGGGRRHESSTGRCAHCRLRTDGWSRIGHGQRRLGDSWNVIPDHEAHRILQQLRHLVRWGGTKAASAGLVPRPPIQFWSVRMMPAKRLSLVPSSKT